MRIGVDGYNLALPSGTGIATYTKELVAALQGMGNSVDGVFGLDVPVEPSMRQAAFFDQYRRRAASPRRPGWYRRPWQYSRKLIRAFGRHSLREVPLDDNVVLTLDGTAAIPHFNRLFSSARLFDDAMFVFAKTGRFTAVRLPDPPSVMHWTYPMPLRLVGSRNVYTLHDLVPLKLPYATLDNKAQYIRLVAQCVRTASQLCTVSEASKRDIVDYFGVDPARVTNTYQSVSFPPEPTAVDAKEAARSIEALFGLAHRGYFLYFGAIEPKKNVGRLIEAFLSLGGSTSLVIVGAPAWQSEDELRLMPGDGVSGSGGTYHGHRGQVIVRLDYLSSALLAQLIAGARAVVFPSLYEGFGLPVLEAMQRGTPVITSNTSALPEVAGSAALLVDPYNVRALREAMQRVDRDDDLCRTMAEQGLAQARLFSGERYQQRLTDLYCAAMATL